MLRYNFKRLFDQRDIKQPLAYLISKGFSRNVASHINSGKFRALTISQVERLCRALNCTPNDLVEYVPKEGEQLSGNPLAVLVRDEKLVRMSDLVSKIPIERMPEFSERFEELARSLAGGKD
ncbi:MAG: helix-turn-helix transcriptional regulator [Ignavibacteriales bacterium]|nr:MAG: helix-turn-helix transcriptional regulator [Ignavibacteriales bacterium]